MLPKDDTIPAPGQVQNQFNADPVVSQALNLLRQGKSDVLNGNLLTLPVGGGLLYVQPVYVQSTGETKYPLLQKVLVAFGNKVAFEDTLNEALDVLFGGDSGADAGDGGVAPTPPSAPVDPNAPTAPPTPTEPTAPVSVDAQVQGLLQQAKTALDEKTAAMAAGDWAAYGTADAKLSSILTELITLTGGK